MNKEIRSEIQISASPAKVWQVLSAFEHYPEWNPFVKKLSGEPAPGKKIRVSLPGMGFTPRVLVFDAEREFRWKGQLLLPGIFDGEHYFILQPAPNGSTRFIHGEKFSGILLPLFSKSLDTSTLSGFREMNQALKQRCESL